MKLFKTTFLAALALLMLVSPVLGQNFSGVVVDESNAPVIGAYVLAVKNDNHAHSNELGQFTILDVSIGDTLLISSIGFEKTKYAITNMDERAKIVLGEQSYRIDEVVIRQDVSALNQVAKVDLIRNPVTSSQEVLRVVPGLFVGQHAGGGKAEQIFLRGFDIDHGTDVNIAVEGMPVNMVSHAHGQGYADLHFIIPEAIENVDFNKGTGYIDRGNFTTAGYVDFNLKDRLEDNYFSLELGEFNTSRVLGMFNIIDNAKNSLYIASEFRQSDGPFDSPQQFDRLNVMARYTARFEDQSQLKLTFSHFTSKWDASGQIPIGEVENGNLSRWGAIDDTEGGNTGRTNLQLSFNKRINENSFVKNTMYYSRYDFQLWSNFTFFLRDQVNGDQIMQREVRDLFGLNREMNRSFNLLGNKTLLRAGIGVRYDQVNDVELSDTRNRQTIEEVRAFGDVTEVDAYGYAGLDYEVGKFTISPGLRYDNFHFQYYNRLDSTYKDKRKINGVLSPKLNVVYNINRDAQLFFKSGYGFHSNDSRVVIEQNEGFVPQALGLDLGAIFKPVPKMLLTTTLWYLGLEQEFVYVGDEGIVEPSGETERMGIDLSLRYQLLDWLYFDTDWTFTDARAVEEEEGNDHIPLAPLLTGAGGLSMNHKGFYSSLRFRFLDDRPANEDNSIVAEGFFVLDFNLSYSYRNYSLGIIVENLLDTEWREAQFATESRVRPGAEPIEEIHFTPGFPRFIRFRGSYKF